MVLVDYIGIFFYISEYFWQMTTFRLLNLQIPLTIYHGITYGTCMTHVISFYIWLSFNPIYHGVGSNQFLSVNIGVIRLLSVITTTPFGNYGTSETMFDQKRWKKTKNMGKILPILSFKRNSRILNWINFVTVYPTVFFKIMNNLKSAFVVGAIMWKNKPNVTDWVTWVYYSFNTIHASSTICACSMFYR